MIFSNYVQGRGFVICYGTMTAGEILEVENAKDGEVTQSIYIYNGGATASADGKASLELVPGQINDVSSFAGQKIKHVAGDVGVTWLSINPVPASKRYEVSLLKQGQHVVTGDKNEKVILCVDGSIDCNGKTLQVHNFTRVLDGVAVNVSIPEKGIAVLLTAI